MGAKTSGKGANPSRSPRRTKRYDKELVRDQTLELLTARLGPAKEQGARVVWDCPACGKREKYSVVKAGGKGGCIVADCRLAGSGDVFVMLAGLEDLDYKADFLAVLARSYELLGMEPADSRSNSRGRLQRAARSGAKGTCNEGSAPNAETRDKNHATGTADNVADWTGVRPRAVPVGRQTKIAADSSGEPENLDAHLEFAAQAYERILEMCPLETRDRRYLKTRGLSGATIRRGRFGTMTAPRASQVKARLQREFGREGLLSVPGFSEDEGTGRIKFTLTGNFILVPYHDAGGRVTTIEGRIVGEPPDGRKYVTLRRAGNHLYLFPGHQRGDLVAVCEGAMGAIVAAECGITVGAIMGCERFRASPSLEMLDGAPGDPLLELKGADFAGRPLPYIPDADDPPNPNVLRAAPKAARWIAEPQNAESAVCLLPKGADLDEWLLSLDPKERVDRFAELLASASPPEDAHPLSLRPVSRADTGEPDEKAYAPAPGPENARGSAPGHAAEGPVPSFVESPPQSLDYKNLGNGVGSPPDRGRISTEEDLRWNKGGSKSLKAKISKKSSRRSAVTETSGGGSQPGLWDEPGPDVQSPQTTGRGVSRGARKLRDEVYRALIEKLPPKEEHLRVLEKQGVMRATARVGRFASLDAGAATKAVSDLAERFGAKRLLTVPGFETDKGNKIRLCPATGRAEEHVLIPCFDAEGLLAGVEGLPFDHKSGELDAEETVPLKGAGGHLYVFAHYPSGQAEGFCEGPLGAMLAAQEDVVIGAIGGFRRYRAASGPGEGRQVADAVLPELEGVDLAGRRLAYVPRTLAGEANARYHEAPKAARWLVERQGGDPAVVGLIGGEEAADGDRHGPTSLGAWIDTLSNEEAHDRLREIFPGSPIRQRADVPGSVEDTDAAQKAPADEPVPPLPTKAVLVAVAVAAALGLALGAILLRLRDFAGYVSTTPAGEPVLYPGPLGPLRRLADAAPFRILYDSYPVVVVAAVLGLALFFIAKARARHLAYWRSSQLRLKERWELHRASERFFGPSAAFLTRKEALWGVLAWPLGYLLAGWLLAALEGILGLAASLWMAPEVETLVADPGLASLYSATALSAFVLWRRRSIRSAEARMLAGRIRH